MTVDIAPELVPGQVWEHRHDCKLCSRTAALGGHRHAYVLVRVIDERLVTVKDLNELHQPIGQVYGMPAAQLGSLGRGGLRLVGHLTANGSFVPLPEEEIDRSVVEHEQRIQTRRLTHTIPGTRGGASAGHHVGRRDRGAA